MRSLRDDPYQAGEDNRVAAWAEFLIPETAVGLAYYDNPHFGKYPAITRNNYGKGSLTYQATVLSDQLQEKMMLEILGIAGLMGPDQELFSSVRVKSGLGNRGQPIRYYLNYSDHVQTFLYPHSSGTDLLTHKSIGKSKTITLAPWDLVIVEDR